VVPLLSIRRLEGALRVIKNAVAVQATALEVPALIEGDRHHLLTRPQLLHHFIVSPVEHLNVPLVKRDHDKSIIAECIVDLEFASLLRAQFELISREEVELHFVVLAQDGVHADELDEGGGRIKLELEGGQPVVVEIRVLASDRRDHLIDKVVNEVFQVG